MSNRMSFVFVSRSNMVASSKRRDVRSASVFSFSLRAFALKYLNGFAGAMS